ncbi:hypothetical protein V6N13_029662 [Hibiscus sabdariffa]
MKNKPTVDDRFASWMDVANRKCRQNVIRTRRSSAAVKALPQKDVKTNKKDELDDEQTVIMDLVLKFSNSLTKEGLTVASSSDGSDERPLMVRDGTI